MSRLSDMITRHESSETYAYKCTSGKLSIGVGRNIDAAGGIGLSQDEIAYLLANDIRRCKKELEEFPWFPSLDDVRQDALIDMCFNMGITRLRTFKKAMGAMENQDYQQAADHFFDSRWARQVPNRAIEICDMIRTGEYK